MSKKVESGKNLRLAGLFVLLVFGLITLSLLVKLVFIFKESKFDGIHKFNVVFLNKQNINIVSFSPSSKSIYILKIDKNIDKKLISKTLKVPIDAIVTTTQEINDRNVSSVLFKSILPFGNSFESMTIVDMVRIFLFSRGVLSSSIYEREITKNLNDAQKTTLISLTFTDPTIYEENLSIEVINATDVYGFGSRLASLITNIGGNVILVTSPQILQSKSKIVYFGNALYTHKKLSDILGFPLEKQDKKGISDVIIIIGEESLENINF